MTKSTSTVLVQNHVPIILWKPATPKGCSSIGNQFDAGRSTVGALLSLQGNNCWAAIMCCEDGQCTREKCEQPGFPNCVRVLAGTPVLMICPLSSGSKSVRQQKGLLLPETGLLEGLGPLITSVFT